MSLHYTFEHTPPPGTVQRVAEGVYWVRMPLPFSLDHINLWLLEDSDGWTIIDTGIGDALTREHWREVFNSGVLNGKPVKRVIVTHFHPDHIGSAAWLAQEWNAPVWMTLGEFLAAHAVHGQAPGFDLAAMLEQFAQHGLDEARLNKLHTRGNPYSRIVPELPQRFNRIFSQDVIQIGKHHWHVIIGFGHSPEHAALHCPDLGILISGDMLLPRISTNVSLPPAMPDADSLKWFLSSIARFKALPESTMVLPSHGRPFTGIHARVEALTQHHAERCEDILAACLQPTTATELLPVLFKRELDSHQLMFALGEAIAHLNYLRHDGRIHCTPSADGIMHFVTCSSPPRHP